MDILKRMFTFFVLFVFLNVNILNAYSNDSLIYKDLILSKSELNQTIKGKQYIKEIDKFIINLKNNKNALIKLESKTSLLKEKLKKDNTFKNKTTKNIIIYLNSKAQIMLDDINNEEKKDIIRKSLKDTSKTSLVKIKKIVDVEKDLEEKEEIENNFQNFLTKEEQEKINNKLVKLQLNLLDNSTKTINNLFLEFEKLTNYTQKGDIKMNFDMNQEQFGKINSSLDFKNIIGKTSNFDSSLSGDVNLKFDSKIVGEDDINLDMSAFIDYISSDGNIYLLLDKLNIKQENLDMFNEQIEKIEEIAKENKYIKYTDQSTTEAIKFLKALTPAKFVQESKEIFNKPMFEAYKKVNNKYYLKPTKYSCDKTKELLNKFDPFYGKKCSEGQYEDMLMELAEVGNIYMILGDNDTTLGFEGIKNYDIDSLEGNITFSDKEITRVNFQIIPNQNIFYNEGLKFFYEKYSNLDFAFHADGDNINFEFNSELDKNNKFVNIDYVGDYTSYGESLISKLTLENNKIAGEFFIMDKEEIILKGDILGNTNGINELLDLNISYITNEEKEDEFLKGNISFDNNIIKINNEFIDNYTKSNFEFEAKRNSRNKIITDGKIIFDVYSKNRTFDYETYKYIVSEDFEKNFDMNLNIKNKIISSKIKIYDKENLIMSINSDGKYDKNFIDLKNKFLFEQDGLEQLNLKSAYFLSNNGEQIKIKSFEYNIDLLVDSRNDNNNINLIMTALLNDDEIFKFLFDSKIKIDYKDSDDINIIIPSDSNTIDFEELMY